MVAARLLADQVDNGCFNPVLVVLMVVRYRRRLMNTFEKPHVLNPT